MGCRQTLRWLSLRVLSFLEARKRESLAKREKNYSFPWPPAARARENGTA
jgi:hypothetical protein